MRDLFGESATSLAALMLKCGLVGSGIILVSGSPWKIQRQAGHAAFTRPASLAAFAETLLPKHLKVLIEPFEEATETGAVVDVQTVAYAYAMVVFGELAYDVGP